MSGKYLQTGYTERNKKRDANESEIIEALESVGASVVQLNRPIDLLVGFQGINHMIEVKNPKGKNRITPGQQEFADSWKGRPPVFVTDANQALAAIGMDIGGLSGVRVPRTIPAKVDPE